MSVKIYLGKPLTPDKVIGRIDDEGKIYTLEAVEEEYIGWIDYEEGDVYDDEDVVIGWAEPNGVVLAYYEDEDKESEIGFVNDEGELFYYDENEDEVYFGGLKGFQDYAEGAAALLFFLEAEED